MKLIENTKFEAITSDLASLENGYRLDARLEVWSCKSGTTDERKAFKSFKSIPSSAPDKDTEYLSPPGNHGTGSSPLYESGTPVSGGNILCDTICKKTFWYLVATLNNSYGIDADFSDVKSQMFSREPSVQWVMDRINVNFTTVLGAEYERIKNYVWKAIDDAVTLRDCTVFSFSPDASYDPYAHEQNLWKFWYFFYNRTLKRVCFFQCRAVKSGTDSSESEMEGYFDEEETDTSPYRSAVASY